MRDKILRLLKCGPKRVSWLANHISTINDDAVSLVMELMELRDEGIIDIKYHMVDKEGNLSVGYDEPTDIPDTKLDWGRDITQVVRLRETK